MGDLLWSSTGTSVAAAECPMADHWTYFERYPSNRGAMTQWRDGNGRSRRQQAVVAPTVRMLISASRWSSNSSPRQTELKGFRGDGSTRSARGGERVEKFLRTVVAVSVCGDDLNFTAVVLRAHAVYGRLDTSDLIPDRHHDSHAGCRVTHVSSRRAFGSIRVEKWRPTSTRSTPRDCAQRVLGDHRSPVEHTTCSFGIRVTIDNFPEA